MQIVQPMQAASSMNAIGSGARARPEMAIVRSALACTGTMAG
jgi:hypothetical protein